MRSVMLLEEPTQKMRRNTSFPETGGKKVNMGVNNGKVIVNVLHLWRLTNCFKLSKQL